MIKKLSSDITSFFSAIFACLTISWRTSALYTVLRLSCNLFFPVLSLVSALLGKCILDLLAGLSGCPDPKRYLILFSGGLLFVNVLRSLLQKTQLYAQNMHGDMIGRELALFMMDKAGDADIEYFDNAEYYDKLSACTRDASVISYLLWNTISAAGALFSMLVSSHRLTNVALADRIIVLENGCVLEEGTQQELLERSGRFAELFRYQQERYQTGDVSSHVDSAD